MRHLIGIGYKGNLLALDTRKNLLTRDCLKGIHEHPFITPHSEVALPYLVPRRYKVPSRRPKEELWKLLSRVYASNAYGEKRYGPFGDALSVTILSEYAKGGKIPVILNWIAPKAFLKPGLAGDTIVIASNGLEWYWVGIVRGGDHASGAIAPMGGFLDIRKDILESPLEAAVREAREESSIFVVGKNNALITESELLSREIHEVQVEFCARIPTAHPGTLQFVGVFPTEDEYVTEEPYGLKRVYWAFGHVLFVEFPEDSSLSCEMLHGMCQPRDDARDIYVKKLFENGQTSFPEFPIGHHRKMFEAACVSLVAGGKFPTFQLPV